MKRHRNYLSHSFNNSIILSVCRINIDLLPANILIFQSQLPKFIPQIVRSRDRERDRDREREIERERSSDRERERE